SIGLRCIPARPNSHCHNKARVAPHLLELSQSAMNQTRFSFLNDIAAEVRAALRNGAAIRDASTLALPQSENLVQGVRSGRTLAGTVPPAPPTLRARVGG